MRSSYSAIGKRVQAIVNYDNFRIDEDLVDDYAAMDGTRTYRVRYRSGGKQHSETFRRKSDAETFDVCKEKSIRFTD